MRSEPKRADDLLLKRTNHKNDVINLLQKMLTEQGLHYSIQNTIQNYSTYKQKQENQITY